MEIPLITIKSNILENLLLAHAMVWILNCFFFGNVIAITQGINSGYQQFEWRKAFAIFQFVFALGKICVKYQIRPINFLNANSIRIINLCYLRIHAIYFVFIHLKLRYVHWKPTTNTIKNGIMHTKHKETWFNYN